MKYRLEKFCGMKKKIIIIVVIFLVIALAVGAFFILGNKFLEIEIKKPNSTEIYYKAEEFFGQGRMLSLRTLARG